MRRPISNELGESERLSMGRWLFEGDLVLVGGGGARGLVGGDTGVDNIDSTFDLWALRHCLGEAGTDGQVFLV